MSTFLKKYSQQQCAILLCFEPTVPFIYRFGALYCLEWQRLLLEIRSPSLRKRRNTRDLRNLEDSVAHLIENYSIVCAVSIYTDFLIRKDGNTNKIYKLIYTKLLTRSETRSRTPLRTWPLTRSRTRSRTVLGHALGHGLGHELSHGLGHELSHGLGHELSHRLCHELAVCVQK